MMRNLCSSIYLLLFFLIASSACEEDEPSPVKINFSNTDVGISRSNPSAEVTISFSRPAESDGSIDIAIANSSLTYGEDADFYTDPAAVDMKVSVPFSAGVQSTTFVVGSGSALNITQDESIRLTIEDPEQLFEIGNQSDFTVAFSENFIATSASVQLDAGGADFTHQAFFDLSKIEQTRIDKHTWDLGFYSGESFRVIINNSARMMARLIDKTDLSKVTAEDTVGFGAAQSFSAYNGDAVDWVDAPNGDLDSLALNQVEATDSENKVYIISREGQGRNWKKIRILQNGNGYTLQYADIASSSFETAEVSKDGTFNFSFFDLDNGDVQAEPAKDQWDIMYGTFTNVINFGYYLPYSYNDFIILNRHSTKAAEVLLSDEVSYENFSLADALSLEYSSDQSCIGANWRNGGGPGSDPSIKEDRFYVIVDAESNTYKLRFLSMYSSENGARGYTKIEYELL